MSRSSPLNRITGYNELVDYYNENKDRPWDEWLVFDSTFPKPGKQGLVGIMRAKDNREMKFVFKISQYINYLAEHESTVMEGLNELSDYCPHFSKLIGTIVCKVDPQNRKTGNPFNVTCKYPIEKVVILCEYVEDSCKFYNYIRSDKIDEHILYSTIKQVLMAICIAQRDKQLAHYDLHSCNVMMKKCNKDVVFLYVLDEYNQFVVPSYGHYPVIIDFGFSYINNMEDGPLWTSMAHTDVGFMSDRFDWVADPKLFLVSVSGEVCDKRQSKKSRKFRNVIKNIFSNLTIDWESGWDDVGERGAADYVTEMIEDYNSCSSLFEKYDHYCIDILQTLIIMPIESQDYTDIGKSYKAFLAEWVKIENEITNPFYNLYILKALVDSARHVRAAYYKKSTRSSSISYVTKAVYKKINEITKFCMPKNINFDTLLCAMYVLTKNVEGVLYDVIKARMDLKQLEYNKLPLTSTEQIYAALEANMKEKYEYTKETTVIIFDSINKKTNRMCLTNDQIAQLKDNHPLCLGTMLFDFYKHRKQSNSHTGKC
jgi:hypothetical protein